MMEKVLTALRESVRVPSYKESQMSGMSALSGVSSTFSQRSLQPPSFSKLDSNGDGALKLAELKASAPSGGGRAESVVNAMFSQMDGDGDGSVTSAEKDEFDASIQQRMQSTGFMAKAQAAHQIWPRCWLKRTRTRTGRFPRPSSAPRLT